MNVNIKILILSFIEYQQKKEAKTMESFSYRDSMVYTQQWQYLKVPGKKHVCFCCRCEIKTGDDVVGLINNHKYIPNVILHEKCLNEKKSDTNSLFDDIRKAYEQYKESDAVFGNS